eukprot:2259833-Amphidinium_carterae.1
MTLSSSTSSTSPEKTNPAECPMQLKLNDHEVPLESFLWLALLMVSLWMFPKGTLYSFASTVLQASTVQQTEVQVCPPQQVPFS